MKLQGRHARITGATSGAGTIASGRGEVEALSSDKQLIVLIILIWASAVAVVSFIAGVMIHGRARSRR